jgi:hypothetical protein
MKPAIFNTAMVRSILDGLKTQTRRSITVHEKCVIENTYKEDGYLFVDFDGRVPKKAPYKVGDIIYVRETWGTCNEYELFGNGFPNPAKVIKKHVVYRADNVSPPDDGKWKPSIHMPKEYARLFLRVKDVRVERLNEISDDDAKAEGVNGSMCRNSCTYSNPDAYDDCMYCDITHRCHFRYLWESIYGDGSFDNGYVWVIEFERISKEEAQS